MLHVGQKVSGVIHSKSSHGYFVTVTLGGEQMHGILYHPPTTTPVSLPGRRDTAAGEEGGEGYGAADVAQNQHADGPYGGGDPFGLPGGQAGSRMKKKRRRWLQHSVELAAAGLMPPKQNRTGYNFFFGEWRAKLKAQHPHEADREISRMIGQRWTSMGLEERQVRCAPGAPQSHLEVIKLP